MSHQNEEMPPMVEIADAINAILDADSIDIETHERTMAEKGDVREFDETIIPISESVATNLDDMSETSAQIDAQFSATGTKSVEELDAAIVAALDKTPPASSAAFDLPGQENITPLPQRRRHTREVRADSDLANLALRMRNTLAELHGTSDEGEAGTKNLLEKMEQTHQDIILEMRSEAGKFSEAAATRKQQILNEVEQLDQHGQQTRDALEMLVVRFEASLQELHGRYFGAVEHDHRSLERYRGFLEHLLHEYKT